MAVYPDVSPQPVSCWLYTKQEMCHKGYAQWLGAEASFDNKPRVA
ncbi:MAG: hypothetical protein ACTH69_08295 [Halomonas sp.]|nr:MULTISPECIES: hypothetical protein [Halomonas]